MHAYYLSIVKFYLVNKLFGLLNLDILLDMEIIKYLTNMFY